MLLLLDEPTAGLDPQSRRQLWGGFERIRKDGGSILLTTHSMEEAQAVCDRVAIIDHGTVLTTDTPKDLIERHKDDPRGPRWPTATSRSRTCSSASPGAISVISTPATTAQPAAAHRQVLARRRTAPPW